MVDPLRLPGYAVERLAGSGGSGDVWVAREEATGRHVALKRLRDAGEQQRSDLRREAALLSAVSHPHVLPLRSVIDTPTDVVLVLDLAEGGSLRELVDRRGRLSAGEVVTATAPIAQALAEVHRAGLVHGDISPGNILFTGDGRPLLGDLGVARIAGVRPDAVSATAAYAAPEVLAGAPPTPAADVYGLASVALAALTGAMPTMWDDSAADTLTVLPAASLDLLDRALASRPARRPDAAALADGLFGLATPVPVRLAPAPEPPPAGADLDAAPAQAAASPVGEVAAEVTHAVRPRDVAAAAASPAAGPGPTALTSTPASAPRESPPSPPAAREPRRAVPAAPEATAARTHRVRPRHAEAHGVPQTAPPRGWQHRLGGRGRLLALGAGALVAVAALVVAVLSVVDRGPSAPAAAGGRVSASAVTGAPCSDPSAEARPTALPDNLSAVDWPGIVTQLYGRRSEAFAEADPALLCGVFAPGATGLAKDLDKIEQYRSKGLHAEGLSWKVIDAEANGRDGDAVVVEVTDRLGPYAVSKADGEVVARPEGLESRTWRAALVRLDDGWRFR